MLAVLLACGLRRHEAVKLKLADIQQREDIGRSCTYLETEDTSGPDPFLIGFGLCSMNGW